MEAAVSATSPFILRRIKPARIPFFFLPSSLFPHTSHDVVPTTPAFSAISPVPSLGASLLLQPTPGSDQRFFSRSLVVRRAEPLGATGSHARSNSPSPQKQPTNISN